MENQAPTKIMVVDDEPQLQRLFLQRFRSNIRNEEFELSFALSGVEALENLRQDAGIDIILSDINMPEMDGITFISKLDEINPRLKTVMVSAYGNMKNIRSAMNHGAYDFVTKPIDFADLEATIKKAIKEIELQKLAALTKKKLEQIQKELHAASEVQQSILPKNFSIFPAEYPFDLYAEMIPAKEVGGDFYDFFMLDNEHLGLVIGDVSGKGMASALFMAISRTLLKAVAHKGYPPAECLEQVNYILSQDNPTCMFVTLFYGVLDLSSGDLRYCNGGHNFPYLVHSKGTVSALGGSSNIALGILEDAKFESNTIRIEDGQPLVLYTDGITEAVNQQFEEFSEENLMAYLSGCINTPAREMIKELIREVNQFASGVPQADDITALVIRRMA
ncbi:MAG: PP2C family protein-serine/threonine phosphatase [Saprospiraceae bacterium]